MRRDRTIARQRRTTAEEVSLGHENHASVADRTTQNQR
jgi:hypothetical protein